MVSFCDETVRKIKAAENEERLVKVIGYSLQVLQARKVYNETGYIANMITRLHALNRQELSAKALNNVKLAEAIFQQFQQGKPVRLF